MQPLKHNLKIFQGQTFLAVLRVSNLPDDIPVDFTGRTARMHVRSDLPADPPIVELSTENGGISLGGAAGTITLFMSAAATAALPTGLDYASWVYDLEVTDPLQTPPYVERVVEGSVLVSPEVTR